MNVKNIFLFCILLASLLAAAPSNQSRIDYLTSAYATVNCKTMYLTGIISSVSNITGSDLSTYSNSLENDSATLKSYATAGEIDSYKDFVKETYDSDIKESKEQIKLAMHNATKDQRSAFKGQLQSLEGDYKTCYFNTVKANSEKKIDLYNDQIAKYNSLAANLSAKGINTSGLVTILDNANAQIIQPLQSAINQANNTSDINTALRTYCLYDGCANGTNFHLDAKFEIEKLSQIIIFIEKNPKFQNSSELSSAQQDLSVASSTLSAVGTSQYTKDQSLTIWDNIREASKDIRNAIKTVKKEGENEQ